MPYLIYFITELIGYSPTYKKNPEYIFKNQNQKNKNLRTSFIKVLGEYGRNRNIKYVIFDIFYNRINKVLYNLKVLFNN